MSVFFLFLIKKIHYFFKCRTYSFNKKIIFSAYLESKLDSFSTIEYFCNYILKKTKNRKIFFEIVSVVAKLNKKDFYRIYIGLFFIAFGLFFLFSIFLYVYLENIKLSSTLIILMIAVFFIFLYLKIENYLVRGIYFSTLLNYDFLTREDIYNNTITFFKEKETKKEKDTIHKLLKNIRENNKKKKRI